MAPSEPGSLTFTLEHVGTLCEVLATVLRPEALHALSIALPSDVAALLQPREQPPSHRTLS